MSTMQERTVESDQDKARRCLKYVDPNRSRPDWIAVLTVCKELGLSESEVFAWSNGAEVERRAGQSLFSNQWRNCGKRPGSGGVSIGTLIHFARQDGMPREAVQRRYEVALLSRDEWERRGPPNNWGSYNQHGQPYRYAPRLMTVRYEMPGDPTDKVVIPFHWKDGSRVAGSTTCGPRTSKGRMTPKWSTLSRGRSASTPCAGCMNRTRVEPS